MTADPRLHDRLSAWHVRVRAAMASQRLDLPFAVCVITADLPDVHDLNLVHVTAHVPPSVLVRSIDRLAATAGWRHRRIEVDSPVIADGLRQPLTAAGYTEERFVTMVLTDDAAAAGADRGRMRRPSAVVDVETQIGLSRRVTAEQPWADRDELVEQMVERERRLARLTDATVVIAPPDAPVSRCLLLVDPDSRLVEIDAVSTLVDHRGQGWSNAVMRRAIADACAGGAAHVVLVADDADWPKTWYRRLGFTTVGRSSTFSRNPPP